LCCALGGGLRSPPPSHRIARLLFFVHRDRIGVVHGFITKMQTTSPEDIAMARKLVKDMKALNEFKHPHRGSTLDDFLRKEGPRDTARGGDNARCGMAAWSGHAAEGRPRPNSRSRCAQARRLIEFSTREATCRSRPCTVRAQSSDVICDLSWCESVSVSRIAPVRRWAMPPHPRRGIDSSIATSRAVVVAIWPIANAWA
jgi:hypothetical protein